MSARFFSEILSWRSSKTGILVWKESYGGGCKVVCCRFFQYTNLYLKFKLCWKKCNKKIHALRRADDVYIVGEIYTLRDL